MQTVIIVPLCTLSRSQHVGGTRSCLRRINGPHCPMNLVPRLYSLPPSFPPSLLLFREKRYLLTQQICSQRLRRTYIPPSSTVFIHNCFSKNVSKVQLLSHWGFSSTSVLWLESSAFKSWTLFSGDLRHIPVTGFILVLLTDSWQLRQNIAVWQLCGK